MSTLFSGDFVMNKILFTLAVVFAMGFSTMTFAQDCGCGGRLQKQVGRVKTTVRNTTCRAKAVVKNVACETHSVVARAKNRVKGMVGCNCCQTTAPTIASTTTTTTTCCQTSNCCDRVAVVPTVANWALAPVRATVRMVRPCTSGVCTSTTTVTETLATPTTVAPSTSTPSVVEPTPAAPTEVK